MRIVKKLLGFMDSAMIDEQCLLAIWLQELVLMECMPGPYVSVLRCKNQAGLIGS